ncbi:hypothetical protein LTR10_023904 [Elasticomyces elasticus]|uniref:Uncharacterized protein n=1 Tax=Exophiala sideris TaxID=1016849 RepID=A0ABR0IUA4_9EURO|nr:hypothetical protein LTR10_023904 [Elasticomyces elasticus]KAK5020886.1 hypothetical protein LTS07_011388 [Exophiala sideris]KAK5023011.1 hypothetical protein LTR13_011357 [Exophiala sideris]KAK5048402.1 hypothetical protein LTR69_011390 [Exophiala sideris]KAK5176092.1 hypothetical protein LTR44_011367 [Eurotiomycetes sp. CCFEE 6388]
MAPIAQQILVIIHRWISTFQTQMWGVIVAEVTVLEGETLAIRAGMEVLHGVVATGMAMEVAGLAKMVLGKMVAVMVAEGLAKEAGTGSGGTGSGGTGSGGTGSGGTDAGGIGSGGRGGSGSTSTSTGGLGVLIRDESGTS